MTVGKICNRDVVFIHRQASVSEAARLMREYSRRFPWRSSFGNGGSSAHENIAHCGYPRPLPKERSPRALGATWTTSWS